MAGDVAGGVDVTVAVEVDDGLTSAVGVAVAVADGVAVAVFVGSGVAEGVSVDVAVAILVGLDVARSVDVAVAVGLGIAVGVNVAVGLDEMTNGVGGVAPPSVAPVPASWTSGVPGGLGPGDPATGLRDSDADEAAGAPATALPSATDASTIPGVAEPRATTVPSTRSGALMVGLFEPPPASRPIASPISRLAARVATAVIAAVRFKVRDPSRKQSLHHARRMERLGQALTPGFDAAKCAGNPLFLTSCCMLLCLRAASLRLLAARVDGANPVYDESDTAGVRPGARKRRNRCEDALPPGVSGSRAPGRSRKNGFNLLRIPRMSHLGPACQIGCQATARSRPSS